jgi:hypothetical protein
VHPACERDLAGWSGLVARVVGAAAEAVAAGVPVPLAHCLLSWSEVSRELEADRCDVVVVRVRPSSAGELIDAPDLLLRVLDARLAALAPELGADPAAASQAADLLAARPPLLAARALAEAAAATGHPEQHGGCDRAGTLGLPTVDRDRPLGPARPAVTVRAEGDGFVWSLVLPPGAVPALARQDDRLAVRALTGGRTFRLHAALARCEVRAATVVGDRLEVSLEPVPDAWR